MPPEDPVSDTATQSPALSAPLLTA